jgi:putative NADH-flavin reductase
MTALAISRLIVLGATGSLGRHVLRQALDAGHAVTAFVRTPSQLPAQVAGRIGVQQGDLAALKPAQLARVVAGHDALINCAGNVADGQRFVDLVDGVVASVESLPAADRPVCWLMAGAALLDIDGSGRRAVELPKVKATYWPHRVNFERLQRSSLDWRLLCPGPMVDEPPLGLGRLRISLDRLPVEVPAFARALPGPLVLPIFGSLIPQMIVPYADAAALMLANLDRGSALSRRRVGLALPVGMRGHKPQWTARARDNASTAE